MAVVESVNTGSSVSGNIQYLFDNKDKNNGADGGLLNALSGNSETLYERTLKVDDKLGLILNEMKMVNTHLATSDANKMFSDGVDQSAILAVELDATGDAKSFMNSLEKIAQLDDISLLSVSNGLDSIGMSIDKIIKKDYSKFDPIISSLESFSTGLTKFSQSLPSFKLIAGIAGGIALLGVSIASFASGIGMDDIITLGLVFAGLSLASTLLRGARLNLLKTSLGIATLGISIWAFTELVDTQTVLDFSESLLGLGGAIMLYDVVFSKATARVGLSLNSLSVGIGILGLSMMAFNMVEWESIPKAIASIGGIGLVAVGLSKLKATSTTNLIGLSVAVGVLGLSLQAFDTITAKDVGVALLALGGVGALSYVISKIGKSGFIGAGVVGAMGLSLVAISYGLQKLKEVDISLTDAGVMVATLGLTSGAFMALGIPAVAILVGIGAGVALGMGVALGTLAYSLNAISGVNVTPEQAKNFGESIMNIKNVMVGIGDLSSMPSLLLGIATSALITGATLPLVLASNMVAKVSIPNDKKLEGFSNTILSLKDTFTQFGIFEMGELALVTPIMLLMAGTTIALGGAINLFTKLSTTPDVAKSAVMTIDTFLVGLNTTFSKMGVSEFDTLKKGIDSTMSLGNLLKNLARGIGAISVEMDKNTDFGAIGVSVGSMLQALTAPLSAIGDAKDTISIGGFSITNPFSNKVEKGIEALSGLSNIFMPLSEMIKVFSKDNNENVVKSFKTNMVGILGALGDIFKEFQFDDKEQNLDIMFKATDNASSFIKTITGSNYEPAQKGLMSIAKSTQQMKVAVNEMDLEKLTKLNDLFFNLNQLDEGDGIQAILDALGELIKAMSAQNRTQETTQNNQNVVVNNAPKDSSKTKEETKIDENSLGEIIAQSNGDVIEIMQELTEFMKSGQLKVVTKQPNII